MQKLLYIMLFILFLSCIKTYAQEWEQLSDSVDVLFKNGSYKDALPICEKALQAAEREFGKLDSNYQKTVRVYSDLFYFITDYHKSLEWAKEDSALCERIYYRKSAKFAEVLNNLAILYKKIGSYEQVEPLYLEALEILKEIFGRIHPDYIATMNNLARLYDEIGLLSRSEPVYKELISIIDNEMGGVHPDKDIYLNNYSQMFAQMGRYSDAEALMLQSIELTKQKVGERHPTTAVRLNNLADIYETTGKYSAAEKLYLQAIDIIKEKLGVKHLYYAIYISNLAGLYKKMGRLDKAEDLYKTVIDIIENTLGKSHYRYASAANNLANLYSAMSKLDDARTYFDISIQSLVASLGKSNYRYASFLRNKASNEILAGNYNTADTLLKEAADSAKSSLGSNHPIFSEFLTALADLKLKEEDFHAAEQYYLQAEKLIETSYSDIHPLNALVKFNLATLYNLNNNPKKAKSFFLKSLDITLENIKRNFPSMSEKEKSQYYETIKNRFELFNNFATKYKDSDDFIENIINYRLKTKALLFSASRKVRDRIFASGDSNLIDIFKLWQSQRDYLAKLYGLSNDEIHKQKINLDSLENLANALEKEISLSSEIFAKYHDKDTIKWQNISACLGNNEAAVEIIRFRKFGKIKNKFKNNVYINDLTDSVVYAAIIIKNNKNKNGKPLDIVILKNGNDMENIYLKNYARSIRFKIDDNYSYNAFWKPINDKFKGIKTIYFSTDGCYNQINIASLRNPVNSKYLCDERDLRLLTSLKDLLEIKENIYITKIIKHKSKYNNHITMINMLFLFGSPLFNTDSNMVSNIPELKGTEEEVISIDNMLLSKKWKVDKYIGKDALESVIKATNSPEILHIATHGLFLNKNSSSKQFGNAYNKEDNPLLRSLLLFTGAENSLLTDNYRELNEEDGILTAYEAMNLNLDKTNLVVLSACETGLGETQNGEGVYGMQRAFMAAGAKSVIMSLWTVSDEATMKLMTLFYQNLLNGMESREAFNKAVKTMKNIYKDVYYWAAFVLVGR